MDDETFGACLTRLIRCARNGQSVKSLSNALGYEWPTTVYRWRRGEEIPGLSSPYVEDIIKHLELTQTEAEELRAAQIRSLKVGPQRPTRLGKAPVASLVERGPHPPSRPDATLPLTERATDLQGSSILHDMIALLEGLSDATGLMEEERTIILTWQGRDAFEMDDTLQARWRAALQSTLRRGWYVRHLCRLDGNLTRTVRLVEIMLDFIGAGRYEPRYFTDHRVMTAPYDLIVVPGVVGAHLYSTRSAHCVDAGFIMRNPDHVQSLWAHALQLSDLTAPLLRAYLSPRTNVTYLESLRNAEMEGGGRIVVKQGLSIITQPLEWFDDEPSMLRPVLAPGEDWKRHSTDRRVRIAQFMHDVEHHEHRHISTESALKKLANEGIFARDDALSDLPQEKIFRRDYLKRLVELLRRYKLFQLALVDEHQTNDPGPAGIHIDTIWEATGDHSVFLESWVPNNSGQPVAASLHITEHAVAEGFREYFQQMWEKISTPSRDKDTVIKRIQRYITKLDSEIGPASD